MCVYVYTYVYVYLCMYLDVYRYMYVNTTLSHSLSLTWRPERNQETIIVKMDRNYSKEV